MDILRNVLYTLTYPVWYVLSLLVGAKERAPAIEDSSNDKYPLPPIEKFNPDDAERAKPNDSNTVNAFGEDLAPATFIDDEDEEEDEEGEEEEEEEDEVLDDEDEAGILDNIGSSNDLLPESVKIATDSLQREIEETMKLRDELIATADRNQQRVEAMSGSANTQEPDGNVTEKLHSSVGNITDEAKKAAETVKETAAGAARTVQRGIDRVAERGKEIPTEIARKAEDSVESFSRSLQDELQDVQKFVKTANGQKSSDKETSERMQAVEQAMRDDSGGPPVMTENK